MWFKMEMLFSPLKVKRQLRYTRQIPALGIHLVNLGMLTGMRLI
jgi:hypothetical protein